MSNETKEVDNQSSQNYKINPNYFSSDELVDSINPLPDEQQVEQLKITKKTKFFVRATFGGVIVLLCAIFIIFTGIDLANFKYINKKLININSGSIVFYATSVHFPSLSVSNRQSYIDVQRNLPRFKTLGVTSLIIETPHIYDSNFEVINNELVKFIQISHQVGISIYFRWPSLGVINANDSLVKNKPQLFTRPDQKGYRAFDFRKQEVLNFVLEKLQLYTHADVDGFVFDDMPRVIDPTTQQFKTEFDKATILKLKETLENPDKFIKFQFFTVLDNTRNYTDDSFGLVDYYSNSLNGSSVNYKDLFQSLSAQLVDLNKFTSIIAPAVIFTTNVTLSQKEFLGIMSGYMSLPYAIVLSPGSEYAKFIEEPYSDKIKNASSNDKKIRRII